MQKSRVPQINEEDEQENKLARANRINHQIHLRQKHLKHALQTKNVDELIELENEEIYYNL